MNRKRPILNENQTVSDSFLKRLRTAEHRAVKYSKVVLRFGSELEEYEFSLPLLLLVTHSMKLRRTIEFFLDADGKGSAGGAERGKRSHAGAECGKGSAAEAECGKGSATGAECGKESAAGAECGTRSAAGAEYGKGSPEGAECGSFSTALVIDMPEFQCDVDILQMVEDIVEDICCGMEEKHISTTNVVRLFNAAEFLEIEIVKCKALAFLEETVFISAEKCLDVLATFDSNVVPGIDPLNQDIRAQKREENSPLLEKCTKAYLSNITERSGIDTTKCNVECLLRVANLLPPNVAKHIYESCREERFGLYVVRKNDNPISDVISLHARRGSTSIELSWQIVFLETKSGIPRTAIRWIEELPSFLPDLSRRSLLVLHLAKMIRLGSETKMEIRLSYLGLGFLCGLLIEATRLSTRIEENSLDIEIGFLEKLVIRGLGQPVKDFYFKDLLKLVTKFTFDTLLSIVKRFRSIVPDENIEFFAKFVDNCIMENLKFGSFTPQQALTIYKEFPNDARLSHVELYQTMKTTALSAAEAVDLSKILDYNKVSDDITEKFFGELEYGWESRLVKRVLEIQEVKWIEKEKGDKEITKLQSELSLQTADNKKLGIELKKLRVEKERDVKKLKNQMNRVVKIQKAKEDAAQHDLEEEKTKTTCQICFDNPRDALSLPCMHFLYCVKCLEDHHKKRKTCPACRAFTSGVLKCNMAI